MPDGISLLSLYLPIYIPSLFVKFKTGPATVLKWLIVKKVASMAAVFFTKTVVSSAIAGIILFPSSSVFLFTHKYLYYYVFLLLIFLQLL